MQDYIPELKDIDLTKVSLNDIKNAVSDNIISKMKARLPPEISDNLPENFSRDDILDAVKNLTKDKAMQFAKDNLPPEVYSELEKNEDLISDPSKIGGFMKEKFNSVQGQIEDTVNKYKMEAQSKFDDIKTQLKSQLDEQTQPFKDKLSQLQDAKDSLHESVSNESNAIKAKIN